MNDYQNLLQVLSDVWDSGAALGENSDSKEISLRTNLQVILAIVERRGLVMSNGQLAVPAPGDRPDIYAVAVLEMAQRLHETLRSYHRDFLCELAYDAVQTLTLLAKLLRQNNGNNDSGAG